MSGENHPIDDFLRAIRNEKTAVLHSTGASNEHIVLHDGLQVGIDDGFRYVFSARKWKDHSGRGFLIRLSNSRGQWHPAAASAMPDGKIQVTTEVDLGRNPGKARLREDDTRELDRLVERLTLGEHDAAVNRTTAGWVLGEGTPRIDRCTDVERFIPGYRNLPLNERQRLAVEHALASDVTFIWGPPGTGKTEVVSRIVQGCLHQGARILFLAPSNIAVDQALERICVLLQNESNFDTGLVQRAGDIALTSLREEFGTRISPELLVSQLTAALLEQSARLEEQLARVRENIALHERTRLAEEELTSTRKRHRELRDEITRLAAAVQEARNAARTATEALARIGTPSGFLAEYRQNKIDELRRAEEARSAAALDFETRHRKALDELGRSERAMRAAEQRLPTVKAESTHLEPLNRLRASESRMVDALAELTAEREKAKSTVRDRCRVMGATVSKAIQSRTLLDAVDVVVIDEAGMVALPQAWCVAGLARGRVVVVGDFRQLPAVTHSSGSRTTPDEEREHAKRWLDRDVFNAAGLVDANGTVRPDSRMICLEAQYRMRPAICEVVNEVAYRDAPLRTRRDDLSRIPPSPLVPAPLVLVDTTMRRMPHARGRADGHKTNPVHEAVIHELVRGLQHDTVLPARKWTDRSPTDTMAVIVPYRDQAKVLSKSLHHRFGEGYEGMVDTVHRFQGSQRPLVVIDTVAGAGNKLGYFYEGTGLSSTTCRLLNVALSRAQDHLVVVADVEFLTRNAPRGSEVARLLAHLQRHAHRLSVDDLIPVREAGELAGLSDEERARPAFFPADEVTRAVEWDIARARRSIDIHCAFLDPNPVRRWLRHLKPRMVDNVKVTVHTRPQLEDRKTELVGELRAAGCEVVERERMHEKVVIIDDTVLWHGSLNLLTNTGPTDLMMRLTDPSACERVRRIVTAAKMDRPARPRWQPENRSSGTDVAPGTVLDGRLYLKVPYEELDQFKALVRDRRWNKPIRLWDVPADTSHDLIRRWLPPAS